MPPVKHPLPSLPITPYLTFGTLCHPYVGKGSIKVHHWPSDVGRELCVFHIIMFEQADACVCSLCEPWILLWNSICWEHWLTYRRPQETKAEFLVASLHVMYMLHFWYLPSVMVPYSMYPSLFLLFFSHTSPALCLFCSSHFFLSHAHIITGKLHPVKQELFSL